MTYLPLSRFSILALIYALSTLWFLGCAGLQKTVESPRVALSDIIIQEARPFETAFLIDLRVFNSNDTDLAIEGIDCTLDINGKPFAAGVSRVENIIPAYGTDVVPVVVYASVLDTVNRVIGMIRDAQTSQNFQNLYSTRTQRNPSAVSPSSYFFSAISLRTYPSRSTY